MIRETLLSTAPAQSVAPTAAANWSPAAGASRVVQIIGSSSAIPRSSVRAARPGVFGSSWARLNSEACAHCAARRCWAWRCSTTSPPVPTTANIAAIISNTRTRTAAADPPTTEQRGGTGGTGGEQQPPDD